ncbi:peptidoglycan editing factor PgeF [Natronogracilivirga saccharolytica]|uniref:Purine nucleoside phosphorylase n=1 Tax=Natronogracilivirga saccharolytica TaxID=2812953 RepID=A0A8J7RJL4_9BACT|nr:peptidoglycan editing factor PgeF [Natronogracilivirga saccharolytica]MBP3192427.1 peptidoglycan editing factor PgeF [Natronogracilivirga saccharolytica]
MMTHFWTQHREVLAAFIDKNAEKDGYRLRSVTNVETGSDAIQALEANRVTSSEYLGHHPLKLSMGKQVHGTNIVYTEEPDIYEKTDGLVTDKPDLAVGVLVADCAAVLLADRVHRVIAAVHAGWRGASAGIISKAVNKMMTFGAEPDVMEAYVSPCISKDMFEVGDEVASQFPARFVDRSFPKPHVDLQGFLKHELLVSGMSEEAVKCDERCTYRTAESLHSYRRDGTASGRMLGVIVLT